MFSMCLLVFAFPDVSHIPPCDINSLPLQWQNTLMVRFYSPKSEVMAGSKSTKESQVERADSLRNAPLRDYCEWDSVKCVGGIVVTVDHIDCHDKLMDIHLLPPTVENINSISCSLRPWRVSIYAHARWTTHFTREHCHGH
ncbi:hypothetical protein XU18_3079 [Perkinsela sp. CCAP 1560/4]|nr:hypothetical protein XU18_3079 [Perkinsela sp. CCAP 1560/4]|eukprot:KNH05985.1 hypothetical protein XU18_3079 [Perkinsela sp. CCAP 1560/4]